MCGIAALWHREASDPDIGEVVVQTMLDTMKRRGPDAQGLARLSRGRVTLGHRRLAIIDLSPAGNQPMTIEGGRFAITYNGEIYNYRELRADLEARGERFASSSDTEVILRLYAREGERMLTRLRGMFAFVIWDEREQSLLLARDPYGIKPLYYANDSRRFLAASQVKALIASRLADTTPEPAGHAGFFLWGHIPEPWTLYRGIRQLPAGSFMRVGADGASTSTAFCEIPNEMAAGAANTQESNSLREALLDSVRAHLIADVPVGIFLSAGLDSATIAALAAEVGGRMRSVTLGFEEYRGTANDEVPLAESIARRYGLDHQTVWVTRRDFEGDRDKILAAMDQPSIDGVNTWFVSKAAASTGLKVALSGLGGDELFGGYPSFRQLPRTVGALRHAAVLPSVGRAIRRIAGPLVSRTTSPKYAGLIEYGGTWGGAYLLRRALHMPWELQQVMDPELAREGLARLDIASALAATAAPQRDHFHKVAALESCWYMRNQLLRDTDWASMAHSLEVRVPLVDLTLLRWVVGIDSAGRPPGKREMAATPAAPLPAAILGRRKTGFTVPVREWLMAGQPTAAGRGLRDWSRHVYGVLTRTSH